MSPALLAATAIALERVAAVGAELRCVLVVEGESDRVALGRKLRYGRAMVEALDPGHVPRPLAAVLAAVP